MIGVLDKCPIQPLPMVKHPEAIDPNTRADHAAAGPRVEGPE